MFQLAIEKVSKFTRAIHSISRTFESTIVHPGAATLFFVNSDGWAITCKHVAEYVFGAENVNASYMIYKSELASMIASGKKEKVARRDLQQKYSFYGNTTVQIKNAFINCTQGDLDAELISHPTLDLALIKFSNCRVLISDFPVFPRDSNRLDAGKTLCRLGFPFPEFNNFQYRSDIDDIVWTNSGMQGSPRFPIDGMVTRLVGNGDASNSIVGFEMSTPGLRGQSGGPVFDLDGKIWGVQSMTAHLHLGFDIQQDVYIGGKREAVKDHAFLHVGRCIHIDRIKEFLRENSVSFQEN